MTYKRKYPKLSLSKINRLHKLQIPAEQRSKLMSDLARKKHAKMTAKQRSEMSRSMLRIRWAKWREKHAFCPKKKGI